MRIRSNLLSILEKVSLGLGKIGIGKIPGMKGVYHFTYELLWSMPGKSVREIEGSKMYLDPRAKGPMREAFRGFIRSSGKEKLTTQIFERVVRDGETVVDIGANVGYFTLLAARLVGKKGKVYAFEPEPRNFEVVLKNIALNGYDNVVPNQKAVSNKPGMVKLYLSKTDVGAHTLREYHDHFQFDKSQFGEFIEVEAVTLDGFFKGKEHPIDIVKMDCEGSEMAVLLGMDKVIRNNPALKMFIEFYPAAITEMGYSPEEFVRKLFDYGFSITAIDELRGPQERYLKINSVDELMSLCRGKERIVNLFLER